MNYLCPAHIYHAIEWPTRASKICVLLCVNCAAHLACTDAPLALNHMQANAAIWSGCTGILVRARMPFP